MSNTPRMNAARNETEMGAVGCQLERDLAAANATIADLKLQVCKPADCGKNVRIAELERECEYDQRNAAMSQSESVKLLDRVAELEAELAALRSMQCGPANCALCTSLNEQVAALKAGVAEQYDQIGRLQESNREMWAKEAKAVKELAALKEAVRWHPVGTPPDTSRDVWCHGTIDERGYYANGGWMYYDDDGQPMIWGMYLPTHWCELPRYPKEGE